MTSDSEQPASALADYDAIEQGVCDQIGANLRAVRQQLKISQSELAALINVSRSQYRRYEEGRDLPRLHTAILWSLETGIPTHWLFTGSGHHNWVDIPWHSAWVRILYFINKAPAYALQALQTTLEGLTDQRSTGALQPYLNPNLDTCRACIGDHYYAAISQQLRQFRSEHQLSQETMAQHMGISSAAYKRYEAHGISVQFSMLLIMRFWSASGISPMTLTRDTPVFRYRQLQNDNFAILLPLLQPLSSQQFEHIHALLDTLWQLSGREYLTGRQALKL
jgi:transcriptional regulator with XRE-family HTH domain